MLPAPPSYEEATAGRTKVVICNHEVWDYKYSICWIKSTLSLNHWHEHVFRRQCSLLQRHWDAHRVHMGWPQHQKGLHPKGVSSLCLLVTVATLLWVDAQEKSFFYNVFFVFFRCTLSWWSSFWSLLLLWLFSHFGESDFCFSFGSKITFNLLSLWHYLLIRSYFSDPVKDYIQTNPGWYWAS